MTPIVLASGSASRRAILTGAGIPFEVIRPTVDEEALKPGLSHLTPAELALALAEAKGLSVDAPGALVVGSDQVMEFDGRVFDKPKSREELKERLRKMSGKPHYLRGGVIVAQDGDVIERFSATSTLLMRTMQHDEIDAYVAAIDDDVLGTVGGYALEGLGARIFERVEGDYFAILGLPLFPLLEVLRKEGALPW